MNDKPISVISRLKAQPGKELALKTELLKLVAPSRKDPGCINYDLHIGATDPADFVFYENWTSKALLDAHLATPHLKAFISLKDTLVAESQLTLWEKLGE